MYWLFEWRLNMVEVVVVRIEIEDVEDVEDVEDGGCLDRSC